MDLIQHFFWAGCEIRKYKNIYRQVSCSNVVVEGADISNAYLYGGVGADEYINQSYDSAGQLAWPGYNYVL